MAWLYTPESRAERLIAAVRVVLAASSLFAVWLDPTEPAKFAPVAYGLLAAYLAYSLAVALWVYQAPTLPGAQRWLSHGFDLAFFSLFTYFTSGPASPFIAYFVFSLVCATLRWQWRGTFWTALVALATFLGLAIYFAEVLRDPSFAMLPVIIKAVYLVVFAVLLGYLGAHEERTRREMATLAEWPAPGSRSAVEAARELLATGARALGAPRAVAAWSENEEPWVYLASWSADEFGWSRNASSRLEPLVAAELAGSTFLCSGSDTAGSPVLFRDRGRVRRWQGRPLDAALAARLGPGPLLSAPLAGELHRGRLFFLGKPGLTSDDLVLGEVVARIGASKLDHAYLVEELREAAAAQERVRLARDLHDGVLQSFTGIGLRVAATRRQVEATSASAAAELGELQGVLAGEQRELRRLIEELESASLDEALAARDLAGRLADLAAQVEATWGVAVSLRLDELLTFPSGSAAREVFNMAREAIINAARHARASRIEVSFGRSSDGRLVLTVADDGRGFPFAGRLTLGELEARDIGPRTLRARLAELGGELEIESGESGARLEMRLPIGLVPG